MNTYKFFGLLGVVLVLAGGCKKDPDLVTVNNQIEFTENPDPVKRVSGTYDAVLVDAGFKSGSGVRSYREGNFSLSKPDGSIKGGGYKISIQPAGSQTVTVSVEGSSSNFANVPSHTIGTYTVYAVPNGSTTEYQLRKSLNDPIALLVKRYDAYNELTGFEYDVTFSYYHNKSTGDFHWGEHEEIEPAPTSWFYLNGDEYTVYCKMLRKVSKG